jgi:predicted GIY-YIG superfamily endonuclease
MINKYYFYYFQDAQTNLYYGGITNNIAQRQYRHQMLLNKNLKSDKKPWHLYRNKIQLIVLWPFKTKKEACVYEKQWIINNYLNPLCLNCSVSNSEYDYLWHKKLCERGGGCRAKIRYALEVNNPQIIYTFKSSYEAAQITFVLHNNISLSCKTNLLKNSESGRWLFSDVSIDDLKAKFNKLTQKEIRGNNNYAKGFILIDKKTKEQSSIFYNVNEPQQQGYKINTSPLSKCLQGLTKSIRNYYVTLLL